MQCKGEFAYVAESSAGPRDVGTMHVNFVYIVLPFKRLYGVTDKRSIQNFTELLGSIVSHTGTNTGSWQ